MGACSEPRETFIYSEGLGPITGAYTEGLSPITGIYTIVQNAAVAEPASLALLTLGVALLIGKRGAGRERG